MAFTLRAKRVRVITPRPKEIRDYDERDTSTMIAATRPLALADLGLELPKAPPTQVVSIRLPSSLLNQSTQGLRVRTGRTVSSVDQAAARRIARAQETTHSLTVDLRAQLLEARDSALGGVDVEDFDAADTIVADAPDCDEDVLERTTTR